jgi:hypothetical protein
MGRPTPALTLIVGDYEHPLRSGWCRRAGCAEPAVELGFCGRCLVRYHRERDACEADLARKAAATHRKLTSTAGPDAEPEWTLALSEHMAAEGVDPDAPPDAAALYEALLSALMDFSRPADSELAGLRLAG